MRRIWQWPFGRYSTISKGLHFTRCAHHQRVLLVIFVKFCNFLSESDRHPVSHELRFSGFSTKAHLFYYYLRCSSYITYFHLIVSLNVPNAKAKYKNEWKPKTGIFWFSARSDNATIWGSRSSQVLACPPRGTSLATRSLPSRLRWPLICAVLRVATAR